MMIRVLLVDDHAVVRSGYRRFLEMEPDLRVVGEYPDADSVLEALQRNDGQLDELAEVMVLDLSMPGRSGLDLLRRSRACWPMLKVLVFSMHDNPAMVEQALRAGASGFVTKASQPRELVNAVRAVAHGQIVLSPDVAASRADSGTAPHTQLAPREFDVMRHLVQGLSVEDIAVRLDLSVKTVANYQTRVRQKLDINNGIELLRYAREHGLDAA